MAYRDLRPLGMASFMRAIPGLAEQFSDVPDEYIKRTTEEEAEIACACGHGLTLRAGESLVCNCQRIFVFLVPNVKGSRLAAGSR